jgi:hypothetical protein
VGGGRVSLYPWRPQCGCLIVEGADGEPELAERCGRHDECTLAVVYGYYPPVTSTGCEALDATPGTRVDTTGARAADGPGTVLDDNRAGDGGPR